VTANSKGLKRTPNFFASIEKYTTPKSVQGEVSDLKGRNCNKAPFLKG
jgi:hypothetical protein